jgi:predicted membrane protein (TIGR00267 family)
MNELLRHQLFALLLGLIDGILTVLALATGHVLQPDSPLSLSLSLKVALATSLSGSLIYFFSEYSRQRQRLIHAEKELNLASHGKLATTELGRQIIKETFIGMLISSVFNFFGVMIPLILAVVFPKIQWIAIVAALLLLFFLGLAIARLVFGNAFLWIIALLAAGIIVSIVGYKLHVV